MALSETISEKLKSSALSFREKQERVALLDKFLVNGLPGNKSEEYRFTPIGSKLGKSLGWIPSPTLGTQYEIPPTLGVIQGAITIPLNAGHAIQIPGNLPDGLSISQTETNFTITSDDPFALLNGAFRPSTLIIEASKEITTPICLNHLSSSVPFASSVIIRVRKNASLSVAEIIGTLGAELGNFSLIAEVEDHGKLQMMFLEEPESTFNAVYNATFKQKSNSSIETFTLTTGGGIIRNNFRYQVDGENSVADIFGLYLIKDSTLADNHTVVDHLLPNSGSNELFKGVIGESARGVFNGKIFVRQDAQKTNAFQSNRNILLSGKATVNTKPQLEIWADDVKCSHGCTTGQLDEGALFYLKSRGIDHGTAQAMLLDAFAGEVVEKISNPIFRAFASEKVSRTIQGLK